MFLSAPRGWRQQSGVCVRKPPGEHLGLVAPQLFDLAEARHSCELNGGNQPILIYFSAFWREIIHFQGKSQRNVFKILEKLHKVLKVYCSPEEEVKEAATEGFSLDHSVARQPAGSHCSWQRNSPAQISPIKP